MEHLQSHQGKSRNKAHGKGKAEALRGNNDIARGYHCHKECWNECYPTIVTSPGQPYRCSPKHETSKRLIGPCKVAPKHIEVDKEEACCDGKERKAKHESLPDVLLVDVKEVGCYESGASESRIATRDGRCNYAKYGKNSAYRTHPTYTNLLYHNCRIAQSGKLLVSMLANLTAAAAQMSATTPSVIMAP